MFLNKSRPTDFVVWANENKKELKRIKALRYSESKGILDYMQDIKSIFSSTEDKNADNKPSENNTLIVSNKKSNETDKEKMTLSDTALSNYFLALPLLKKMKWKRLTWDDDADFHSFYRNINACDELFNKIPSFSFLSLHLVKDKQLQFKNAPNSDEYVKYTAGCLTKKFYDLKHDSLDSDMYYTQG